MAKSNIPMDQVMLLVDRIVNELGLIKDQTSACHKITGPTNKHRIYIFTSKTLGRIDTTLPVAGSEGTLQLTASNGAITCYIEPTLEHLERHLRMLADGAIEAQVSNKPRPFGVSKAPKPRAVAPVAAPVPEQVTYRPSEEEGGELDARLAKLRARSRIAKINRYQDEHGLSEADATAVVDGEISLADALAAREHHNAGEVEQLARESGLDFME